MPTFNQAKFIKKAILSVLSQTEKSFELIIVNNNSSDNTSEIVNSFNDSRIKMFNFKNNGVIAASRNLGIQKSNGRFIAFLDSDDIWYPKKLEECLKIIKKGYNFISHKVYFKGRSYNINRIGVIKDFSLDSLLFRGNFIATSSVIVRKSLLNNLNGFSTKEEIVNSEDFDLWLRILSSENGFMIPMILGENIIHNLNASNNLEKSYNSAKNVLDSFFKNDNLFKKHKSLGILLYSFGMAHFEISRYKVALNYFKNSLKNNPLLIRSYIFIILSYVRIFLKNIKVS